MVEQGNLAWNFPGNVTEGSTPLGPKSVQRWGNMKAKYKPGYTAYLKSISHHWVSKW